MRKIELLAPVGDFERLITAIHFGCDAVYFAGKKFGLRAFADNFDEEEMIKAVDYAKGHNVKVYITVNILAHNIDFDGMSEYLKFLDSIGVDGVIVSDLGIASLVKQLTNLELHVSTQANITNIYAAKTWVNLGAKRLVLARELTIEEIKEIKNAVGEDIDIECFCHGAMCISYSGRCLLSNYLTGRDSNKGECAQPCRWDYAISVNDDNRREQYFPIQEDGRGTYILNSKDLCLINHIRELCEAGISSFKIEGRMKSNYYVATVINAYRRAIDNYINNSSPTFDYLEELRKTSNRVFARGFYFGDGDKTNIHTSSSTQTHQYIALVVEPSENGYVTVELRNKFRIGDELEILSSNENFNKSFIVEEILDKDTKESYEEVKKVKQRIYVKTNLQLNANDVLRRKEINEN